MTISRLPSGRFRAQVWHQGHWVPAASIIGGERSYATKTDAKRAKRQAQEKLAHASLQSMTVAEFAERWKTDPLFRRPKKSTNVHNAERIKGFVSKNGNLPLAGVTDEIVAQWIAGGRNLATVPVLKAMFNDAASAKAGRLVQHNPFGGLRLRKGRGLAHRDPPSEAMVWKLIHAARELTSPSFAAWLQVACFTGMRPGELDALRWPAIDLDHGRIRVVEQYNMKTKDFSLPKNGLKRSAPLTPPAREALLALPREADLRPEKSADSSASDFCFVNLRREHWTQSARAYHWKSVRSAVGFTGSLYLATRHFAGWYMTNVLGLPAEDVAIALGHTDGGYLVRSTYGHRDMEQALERVRNAYESTGTVRPFKARGETA